MTVSPPRTTSPPRLAVALDTDDRERAVRWAEQVEPHADYLKVGLEFFLMHGAAGVRTVRDAAPRCGLFLDLKLMDIPATVAGAARAVAPLEPAYLTVHAAGGGDMVAAAVGELPRTRVTAVTVLTSLNETDMDALGLPPAQDAAQRWAAVAVSNGARAVVSSAHEVPGLRPVVGDDVHLVTPGIRPRDGDYGDQARVVTPTRAAQVGADLVVVGRPITRDEDPATAAERIRRELDASGSQEPGI